MPFIQKWQLLKRFAAFQKPKGRLAMVEIYGYQQPKLRNINLKKGTGQIPVRTWRIFHLPLHGRRASWQNI
jgi:hypothetical protein